METVNAPGLQEPQQQQGEDQYAYNEYDNPYPKQGDEESQQQQQQTPLPQISRPVVAFGGFDFSVLKRPPTLMMLINMGLLLLTSLIATGWRGSTDWWYLFVDGYSFFVATLLIPFFILIFFVVILIFQFDNHLPNINFPFAFLINCAISAFFIAISSSVVLGYSRKYHCDHWNCSHLIAVGIFGFICVAGLSVEAVLHFMEIRAAR